MQEIPRQQNTKHNGTRNKQNRTSTPTLHKKTPSTTPHKQIANPIRIPTQNHSRNTPNTKLSPIPHTTTQHQTAIQLPKVADRPGPRGAVGRSWGGGGAAGPLVGPAGMGFGARIAGGWATVGAP